MLNRGEYLTTEELINSGVFIVGDNVRIARTCTITEPESLCIGDNARIDGYTTITGKVNIGNNVHVGSNCALIGGGYITLEPYSGLSHGVKLFSVADDLSGEHMVNPTNNNTNPKEGHIILKRFAVACAGAIIMPDVTLEEGAVLGALSMATKDLKEWGIYTGTPPRRVKNRSKKMREMV